MNATSNNSTSQMLLEDNLVYEVRDGGYQIGSGKGNIYSGRMGEGVVNLFGCDG